MIQLLTETMLSFYDHHEGVSYPVDYMPPGQDNFLATKGFEPLNPIYGKSLTNLSKSTEANLNYLRRKLIQHDPCYEYGMEHWHTDHREPRPTPLFSDDYPQDRIPRWETNNGVFTDNEKMDKQSWNQPPQPGENDKEYPDNKEVRTCYLCSTLDEHRQHLARRGPQLKPKPKYKPRVQFIPPPPTVKKKLKEVEEKQEALYKVVVRTANKSDAGTGAAVTIRIKGRKGWMQKKTLKKKLAVNFVFGRGTSETFHIKGPDIGDLQWLIIEHDGLEKKHGWLLEEVEITKMSTEQIWVFICKQWLSLYHGDYSIKKELKAQVREILEMEYEVTVITAKESMSGTEATVSITFHGKKGVSPKFSLKNKSEDMFQRGKKDKFNIVTKDIGPLSSIKLEHDNTGQSPDWCVEMVTVQELEEPGRLYTFPCGQWLFRDEDGDDTALTLYPLGKGQGGYRGGAISKGHSRKGSHKAEMVDQIPYDFIILTGTRRYAGTDANVFIKIFGKLGTAKEVEFKDTNGKRFEKGATDTFNKVMTDDVGNIKQIQLRHDNKGMAAGWFCEEITIKRYFSKEEIAEKLRDMQADMDEEMNRRASMLAGEDVDLSPAHRPKRATIKSSKKNKDMKDDSSPKRQKRPGSASSRRSWRGSKSELTSITEESEEERAKDKSRRKTGKKTKTLSYGGITMVVTDDEDDEPRNLRRNKRDEDSDGDSNSKSKYSRRKTRSNRDDSDSDDETTYYKGKKKSKNRHTQDSSSDSDDHQPRRRNKKRSEKDTDSSDSNSDSDDDRQQHRTLKRHQKDESSSDEDVRVYTKFCEDRIPYCDEYVFPCKKWLALDEADGQIMRVLKPQSITTFYRMIEK